jgi:endogenous inhibitor of DNA gyrase (YacG/DUF329 family)
MAKRKSIKVCKTCGSPLNKGKYFCSKRCRIKDPWEQIFGDGQYAVVGDCWIWQKRIDRLGYGRVGVGGRPSRYAHIEAYKLVNGPIPDGLELDHLCRNRRCMRPDHLDPVTHLENMRRGKWATATHCKWGHEFTIENTRISIGDKGRTRRTCRACCTLAGIALRRAAMA